MLTCLPFRCQMQIEWSSEPLTTHLPFWSNTLKAAKMQCCMFLWPAQQAAPVLNQDQKSEPCIAALTFKDKTAKTNMQHVLQCTQVASCHRKEPRSHADKLEGLIIRERGSNCTYFSGP